MYIKRLSLYGFKSFALETNIDFYEGVTVVLGPNGIGKSNIVEAFLWVLGEQSTSRLRLDSSRGLESVIFHGTDSHKPSSLAEVSLTLDNKTRWIKGYDIDDVIITRKYYRKGLSEYYINNEVSRLKDIVDMFLDTGLSKNAYSVIKQGTVDTIAKQKPEDRRTLIEDAAGISKYLERRREATKKLEESENNLMAVKSSIREAEKHFKTLKDQAERTERYYKLVDERKKVQIHLSVNQIKKARATLDAHKKELEEFEAKRTELEQELKDLDNKKKDELLRFEETRALSIELDKQATLIFSELTHVERMRSQLEGQLHGISKDKEESIAKKNHIAKRLETNTEEIKTYDLEIEKINQSIEKNIEEQTRESNLIAEEQNKISEYNQNIVILTEANNKANIDIAEARERQQEVINKIIAEIGDKKRDLMQTSFYQNMDKHEQDINIGFQNLLSSIESKMRTIVDFEETNIFNNFNENSFNVLSNFVRQLKDKLEIEQKDTTLLRDIYKEYNKIKDPFIDLLFNKESTYTQKEMIDNEIKNLDTAIKNNIEEIEINNSNIKISTERIAQSNSKLTTLTVENARFEGTKHTLEEKKVMVFNAMKSLEDELKTIDEKIARLDTEFNEMNANVSEHQKKVLDLKEERTKVDKENKAKAAEIKNAESAISNFEANLSKRVKRLTDVNDGVTRLRERINQSNEKIKEVSETFYQNYGTKLEEFEAQTEGIVDEVQLKTKYDNISEKIKNLGHINEMALDEYQEAKEHYEFLVKQKEDLDKSKEEIINIITEANKKASEDFLTTFNEINTRFSDTFKTLFGGGKAGLVIQNPEDLLNSPIDIIAQPPGKKQENIVAYSGGELAMTGLALVFAIFLYRPSPFCILDEVDAALDGANIIRYKNMVKSLADKTQFLIITHDEVSATIADTYYGITAEEKGISKVFTVKIDKDGSVNGSKEAVVKD